MKTIIVVSVLIIALVGLVFVWPTPYSYYTLKVYGVERIIRINRFTGTTERLKDDGWHQYVKITEPTTVEAPAAPAKPIEPDDGFVDITNQIKGKTQPQQQSDPKK